MVICWERAVPLAFRWCLFLIYAVPFTCRCLGQDTEFDIVAVSYIMSLMPYLGISIAFYFDVVGGKWKLILLYFSVSRVKLTGPITTLVFFSAI